MRAKAAVGPCARRSGDRIGARVQLRVGHDPVHQAQLRRALRIERIGDERELERAAQPHDARQVVRAAAVGRGADVRVGEGELGTLGGDRQVAGEHHREPPARHGAVHLRDHRLGEVAQVVDDLVEGAGPFADEARHLRQVRVEVGDVPARHERLAGAREQDGAHGSVGSDLRQVPAQPRNHAGAEGVQLLGAVQHQAHDGAIAGEEDIGHWVGGPSSEAGMIPRLMYTGRRCWRNVFSCTRKTSPVMSATMPPTRKVLGRADDARRATPPRSGRGVRSR